MITPEGSFWLYSVIAVLTWLFAYFMLPEMTNVSLNDVHAALDSHRAGGGTAQGPGNQGYEPVLGSDSEEEEEEGEEREGAGDEEEAWSAR